MIVAIVLLAVSFIVFSVIMFCYRNKNTSGILYFQESDKAMYLELNTEEIPKNGYVTLKIRRL